MRALLAAFAVAATGVHHTPAGTAAAHKALLRPADLGAGWVAGTTPKKAGTLTCTTAAPPKGVTETGSAVSPTFHSSATGPFVSQSAYVYSSAAGATKLFAHIGGSTAVKCLAQSFLGADSSNTVTFTVTKQQTLRAPKVNGQATAYRVVGRASVSAQRVRIYVDIVLIRRGNAIAEVSYASFAVPLAASVEAHIARAAANRL
ncbi:MAG TPA: hypothetical protein VHC01_01280 [Gaiellaceae bacterium]|jgi:hypothetical protein|nr:hypothetical protein [Gaiellaceae bacterium]